MLSSLLLLSAVASGQTGPLEIVNPRPTYGYLGATHPAVKGRLPGDIVHFTFDIKNLKLDERGQASYSMLVELTDGQGNLVFKLGPTNAIAQNYLGGDSLPCSAHLEIPFEATPGAIDFKVTVTDRTTDKSVVFHRKGAILAPDFGLVRIATFGDRDGKVPAAPIGVVGQSLYVGFAPVGFVRDKASKQPDLAVSLRVLDDKGQPTFAKPLSGVVNKDVPAEAHILPMQFAITLNRVGTFTLELEAVDKISGKRSKATLPLKVAPLN